MPTRTHVTHEFPALYDRESRVLLLGSIPSPKSREMAFCTIVGASDTSIEDPVVNNIKELVEKSKVTRIFCTGATAHKLYQKFCAKDVGMDAIKLPSTSPANCAVSLERLVEEYKVILE